MSPITTAAAIQAYVDYLNGLFNTLLTDSRLMGRRHTQNFLIHRRQHGRELPLELPNGRFLHFRQFVIGVEGHVQVEQYEYTYSTSDDRCDESAWICRYDYDREPEDGEHVPQAHLHINAEGQEGWRLKHSLKQTHFATQRVSVEHLIWYVIEEGGARPKIRRDRALRKLQESYRGFAARRTDVELAKFP